MGHHHRFFVPPEAICGDRVRLDGAIAHQICRVLRLRSGVRILALDATGWQHEVELTAVGGEEVRGLVRHRSPASGEPATALTVYQALLKGDRLEYVLQKGTELGVTCFIPTICERCVVDPGDRADRRRERWQRIVQEAAEQARRGQIPAVEPPVSFAQALEEGPQDARVAAPVEDGARGLTLLLWEGPAGSSLRTVLEKASGAGGLQAVSLFVGPEGGFTPREVELAQAAGAMPVSLGPRTLRAETAALVAASVILYELGDLE